MEPAYVSALFGLAGAVVGGMASFLTSWSTQRTQARAKHIESQQSRRLDLFDSFISEASRLYADALSHERDDVSEMVLLYAMAARMQLIASAKVVAAAHDVMNAIAEAYVAPNLTLIEMRERAQDGRLDILAQFSEACRQDLLAFSDRHR